MGDCCNSGLKGGGLTVQDRHDLYNQFQILNGKIDAILEPCDIERACATAKLVDAFADGEADDLFFTGDGPPQIRFEINGTGELDVIYEQFVFASDKMVGNYVTIESESIGFFQDAECTTLSQVYGGIQQSNPAQYPTLYQTLNHGLETPIKTSSVAYAFVPKNEFICHTMTGTKYVNGCPHQIRLRGIIPFDINTMPTVTGDVRGFYTLEDLTYEP